jgi:hypothetical protein
MIKKLITFALATLAVSSSFGQTPNLAQPYSFGIYQKLSPQIYDQNSRLHSSIRPLFLDDSLLKDAADSIFNYGIIDTSRGSWGHRKLLKEHLVDVKGDGYSAYIDFLPDFRIGQDTEDQNTTWLNTRGFQVGGTVGNKFSFYTSGFENQGKFAGYYRRYIDSQLVVPGQSYDRSFGRSEVKDWSYVSALVSYTPAKFLNITVGQDKNFIGDGYRSMILSDYASNYPFIRLTGQLGNVQYMAMWAAMQDPSATQVSYDVGYRKKGGVFHYLDWNVNDKLSIGFFDAVIWSQTDDAGNKRGFDWSYANPIIFLRPLEATSGSPDNSVLGFTGKYEALKNLAVYGQFLLDEFSSKEFFKGNGYHGNKFGIQLGLRGYSAFKVSNLNFLAEFNTARPYAYSGRTQILNYGHYNEPLAHPMGANFREILTIWDYAFKRWQFTAQANLAQYGLDEGETNSGKNIFESHNERLGNYGNTITQGIKTNLSFINARVGYIINPKTNLRVEAGMISRQESNYIATGNTRWFTFGLRSTFRNIYQDI